MKKAIMNNFIPTRQAAEVKWTDCRRNAKHQDGFKNEEKTFENLRRH